MTQTDPNQTPDQPKSVSPLLKMALELGPVILFFIAYIKLKDEIYTIGGTDYAGFIIVTAGFIPLMIASTGILWWLTGHLSKMQIMTVVLVVVFGGLSVWLNDPRFIKMKRQSFIFSLQERSARGLLQGKSYLRALMDGVMPLTHDGWMLLTKRLTAFFLGLAVANELVWRLMSEQAWVNFKTFGLTAAIFVFFMTQGKLFKEYNSGEE